MKDDIIDCSYYLKAMVEQSFIKEEKSRVK